MEVPWWICNIHQGKHAKWTVILHTWQTLSSESWVDQLPHFFTHESEFTRVFTHPEPLVNQALSVKVWPKDTCELVYLSHFSLISIAGLISFLFYFLTVFIGIWLQCTKNSLGWQLYNIVHINWGQLPERPRFHKSNLNLEEPFKPYPHIPASLYRRSSGRPVNPSPDRGRGGWGGGGADKETGAPKTFLLK